MCVPQTDLAFGDGTRYAKSCEAVYDRSSDLDLRNLPMEAFDAEYWQILTGRKVASKTSFKILIASYRQSDRWTDLSPRSRKDYERVHEYLLEKLGKKNATTTKRADIIAAMEANRHRIRFANYI